MQSQVVSLPSVLNSFTEQWSPRLVGQINETHIKVAKIQNEFVWHRHPNSDECFIILEGEMVLQMRPEDGGDRILKKGDVFNVPKNVAHCPKASSGECQIMMIEAVGTENIGDSDRRYVGHT